jgi:hypothetical protein
MTLLETWLDLTEPWNEVFPQNRTALARDAMGLGPWCVWGAGR